MQSTVRVDINAQVVTGKTDGILLCGCLSWWGLKIPSNHVQNVRLTV